MENSFRESSILDQESDNSFISLRNFISKLNNEDDELSENIDFIKESLLYLQKEHEHSALKLVKLNNGYLVFKKKIIKKPKEIISKYIIKTNMTTNEKTKIFLKNIEGDIIETINIIKYKILLKDDNYSFKYDKEITISKPFIYEVKDNECYYPIFCGNNKIYKLYPKQRFKCEEIQINMNINLILQIKERLFIISCDEGTYYYKDSIFEINKKLQVNGIKIFDKSFKKGEIIYNRYLILVDNKSDKTGGNLYIYDIKKLKLYKHIKSNYPFIKKSLAVINLEENDEKIKIILCAYKRNGILLIKIKQDENQEIEIFENFCDINFNIKFICPLRDINEINENVEIDTKFIIVVGEDDNENEMRLYKINGLENNCYPTTELARFMSLIKKENEKEKEKEKRKYLNGMSFIEQSKTKGNLIIGYYNGNTIELNFIND